MNPIERATAAAATGCAHSLACADPAEESPAYASAPTVIDVPQRHHDASMLASRCMRTTLTLDDDVAARLYAEARRTGRPFKSVVNERLRMALAQNAAVQKRKPFKIKPRAMGGPTDGASYDNVGALLEEIEGARHG